MLTAPSIPEPRAPLTGTGRSSGRHQHQRWVTALCPQNKALVLRDRELAQLCGISVSHKKGTLDKQLVLKHRLLITCIKHTSAQQRCVTGYNS